MRKVFTLMFLLFLGSSFAQLQGKVVVIESDRAFVDVGTQMGLNNSLQSGALYRGNEQVAVFKVLQPGYDLSLIAVQPIAGKTVQIGDLVLFNSNSLTTSYPSYQANVGGVEVYSSSSPTTSLPSYQAQASNFQAVTEYSSAGSGRGPSNYEISLGRPSGGYNTNYTGTVEPWRIYNPDLLIVEGTPLANLLQLAWDMRAYGFHQEALQTYLIILERYPHAYEAHNALAAYYREQGDWQNARAAYTSALTYAPSAEVQTNIHYVLGRIDRDSRWGVATVDSFERGYSFFEQGNYNSAVSHFSEVTHLAPSWIEGHYWLARSQLQLGQHNEARNGLNYVLQTESNQNSDIYKGARYLLTTF